MKSLFRIPCVLTLAAGLYLQAGVPSARADGCATISVAGVAGLGIVDGALGALPSPMTIGGVPGLLSSVITFVRTTGSNGQGAQHVTLRHTFISTDPARPGSFYTADRAILSPAGTDPNIGLINDVMDIVAGEGVFANADGFMMNHAILNLYTFTLEYSAHGRICADGL